MSPAKSQDKPDSEKPPQRSPGAAAPRNRLQETVSAWTRRLQQVELDREEKLCAAYRKYADTLRDVQRRGQETFDEAARQLAEAVKGDQASEEPARRQKAHEAYCDVLQKAWREGQRSYHDAHCAYQKAVQAAYQEGREEYESTYRSYVAALAKATADLDVESADWPLVWHLGSQLMTVAYPAGYPYVC